MNKETEAPVVEQIEGLEAEKVNTEYRLGPDGTICRTNDYQENPEAFQEQMA
jgi:hypothetical protein